MGQTHRTIDRRTAKTDRESVAARLAAEQEKKRQAQAAQTAQGTQQQKAPAGSYYSPREYGTQAEALRQQAEAARQAMAEQQKALRESQRALEQLHRTAQEKRDRWETIQGKLRGENAQELYRQAETERSEAVRLYREGLAAHEQVRTVYQPYEDAYNQAASAYNDYIRTEQEAYGQWKSTIRGAEDIRAEQSQLKEKRAELVRLMRQSNEIAAGTAAPGIMAQAAQTEARIRELQEYLGGVGEREKLLEEELGYSEYFRFEDLRQNADFAARSANAGVQDEIYRLVNRDPAAVRAQAGQAIDRSHLQQMSDEEVQLYNYLYSTGGHLAADEYLEHLRRDLTDRRQEAIGGAIDQTVRQEGFVGSAAASAASALMSPMSGLQTALGQVTTQLIGGEIDPNASYNDASNIKNALRQSVTGVVEENFGPVGSFLYGTGMSMADMLMDSMVGGPGAMALIGSRAFAEEVIDGKRRGLEDWEALTLGGVSALAEVLTEKIGLDERLHLPKKWETAGFWKGALRGAIGEAAEEGLTNIANLLADIGIAGDRSNFSMSIEQYKAEDMDDEEALKQALEDAGLSLVLDAAGGAVSGGVFGGYRGWQGKRAANMQQNEKNAADKAAKPPEGEEMPPQSQSDSSPTQSAGEPLETADGAAETVSKMETVDNGTDAHDNGTVRSSRTVGEPVRPGAGLEELKQQAMNRRNPLISGTLPTAQDEELLRRIRDAGTKTEVTALDHGVSQEKTQEAMRIGELIGRTIVFDPPGSSYNGFYHRPSGEIHISADATDILAATVGHELTHSIELTESWQELKRMVAKRMAETGTSWEAAARERKEVNAAAGNVLPDQDTVDQEIVAHYVEKHLLTDEQSIRKLVREDRSVARIILDWLDGLWAKVARTAKSKEREFIRRARETYRQAMAEEKTQRNRREAMAAARSAYANGDDAAGDAALEAAMTDKPEGWLETEGPEYEDLSQVPEDYDGPEYDHLIPFSFGGKNAKWADREALERAQRMEEQGFDKRQIFRDTGWFRGADGKWRFEIDDSKMKYHRAGDAQFMKDHPEYVRLQELTGKMLEATITEEEFAELQELQQVWGRERARLNKRVEDGIADLENLIDHEELFEQYPFLRNTKVRFEDLGSKSAQYKRSINTIILDESLRSAPEDILVHEIQHAIQDMEGFARGSNTREWGKAAGIATENYQEERDALKLLYEETGYSAFMAEQFERLLRGEITAQERTEAGERFLEQTGKMDLVQTYRRRLNEAYEKMQRLNKLTESRTGFELYESTAGEVEARDVTARRGLDANARRETMPNTGDENTVFAESLGRSGDVRFSMDRTIQETDSAGRELSAEQQRFFKDSKVRDEAGRLMVVYHGTNGNFTEFNARDGVYWFSRFEDYAESMAEERGGDKVIRAYLNVKKPYEATLPPGRFSDPVYERPIIAEAKERGCDGVIIDCETANPLEEETFYVAFHPGQIKSVDNTKPTDDPDIRYSVREREEEGGFTKGWHDDDEAARAAQMEGYPVINGVQVVPMKTWVKNNSIVTDKHGMPILDKEGNPQRRNNYGLVAGLGSKPGTLKINFHNKHVYNEYYGETVRRDGVEIDIADLTPTPGVFQQTDEDFQSLMEQAPEEPGSHDYTDEELAELEEMRRRAYMEEDAKGRKEWTPVERDKLSGRAAEKLGEAEWKLTANVAAAMDVPRQASRDFLKPIVTELANEYMKKGTISPEVRDRLFEKAWEMGRVVDQEFYDTYKEVKDHLRSTKVTLSETDRDSRDWEEFRKRAFGTLRIVNEGGTPADVLWRELQEMAPALFPDDILNPEDQLKHMYEVGSSIRKVEKTLDEHYGPDAAYAKQMTRNDFDTAVADCIRGLWEVKRYADEQRTEAAAVTDEKGAVLTEEEITALYPRLKDARRALERAKARNLLNKNDRNQVQRLLRHDIQPEHLDPGTDNVRGILAVYEAQKAFEEIAEPIRRWNRQRKAKLYAEAEELVYAAEMAGGIEDKGKGFLYSRETMERNLRDIVKDRASADKLVDTYIKPVHQGEAAATRMKNEYRKRVKELDISRKVRKGDQVSEAYAVQFYGEVSDILRLMEQSRFRLKQRDGKSYKEWQAELQKLWEENPSLDKDKIARAAAEMGKIYEELFAQMNQVRVRNGYEPINHRSGYFPHFQQDGRDGVLSQFGKALGIDVEVQALPTSINGMTHTFKPGIRWFGNALERKTFDTAYDAVEGFDRYIEGCASVIYQTDNIQRLRALANQIRYRTGDEGLREQIRKIQAQEGLTDEQRDAMIRETASEGKFQLSNFVVELDEYTNLLANKKSRADRNMEQAMGRDMYNIVKGLESRVAANMVAINPGSWLTNFIPITQGWAALDTRYWLKGMGQTLRAVKTDDGMVDMSDFLTNRVGSDALVQTTAQKASGVLSSPMEWIDGFTAGSLVRARFAQNVAQGMSEAEAMSEADEWAAGVMADRSKGAMPTVFHRSNPLTKVFTQFQLEVNNQLSYMFKDIPREKRKKGALAVAAALLKMALGAWLYNELYEKAFGRRPALDPIDMAFGFVKDWADPELDLADAAMNLGGKIAENTPFVGGLVGGGRVPISSALPSATNLVKAVGDSDWSAGKKLAAAGKELAKPLAYMVLPFGGGQAKKIWEGIQMIRKDGSYTVDKDGRPLLQYPLYSTNDAVQKALEAGQAMIFGKTTIRSGRAWVEGGFKNLSADQTATYQALVNLGVEQADAFELMQELRGAEKTGEQSRAQVQRDILRSSGLEGDALGIVYYDLLVDDGSKEKALMEALQKDGADMGAVANCLMDMKDAADSNAKRDILRASGLTDEQKQDIYRDRISDSYDERIGKFREAGMDMNDFLIAQNEYTRIKDSYEDEGDMATAFARWVNNSGYTAAQKAVIRDSLKYWRQLPANADGYDRAIEAGLSDADAAELVEAIGELEPPEGKTSVQEIQKYRVAIDQSVSESNQLKMLQSVGLKDSSYDKVAKGYEMGVAPAAWVRVKEVQQQFDANGNGSMTNAEWEAAIEGICSYGIVLPGDNTRFNLTNEQKAVLWQMLVGKNTKSKNNPFNPEAGQRWRELMGYE